MHLVGLQKQEKALAFPEKPKRRSELTRGIFGVPGAEQKRTISHRNKNTALEQKDAFKKGSDRTIDIVTRIREEAEETKEVLGTQ